MAAYSYLEKDNLADALHDSEEYMKGFYENIPELQRISRGKPGKVPKGKPKVTDGTIAGIRRETPKQIIQQLPTGNVIIKGNPQMQDQANAVLQDVILQNANAGGTPYSKAKRGIKNTIDVGSAWAECFLNRRGSVIHADYRIKHYRDVLFEDGKVSEFDTNYMPVITWMTKSDLKALIWQQEHLADSAKERKEKYEGEWDVPALKELFDKGPNPKEEDHKTEAEKKANNDVGFFKLVKFYQIGVGASFYTWAPAIKKVVGTCISKDPRGIIPVHGLVPEEDDENPLGEPLAAISAGKQNLQDFNMQMFQYGEGMSYSPTIKKWGQTPTHKIKIMPDNVIEMTGKKQDGDDFEVVDLGNSSRSRFAENYGLLKTQMQAEMGRRSDSSVSSESGNPGFSKTDAGVKQSMAVTNISDNDLRKSTEAWKGRIFETLLNIQFAESQGKKEVDFEPQTMERYKLESNTVDYSQELGPIKFTVDASSSKAQDDEKQSEKLVALLDIKEKHADTADEKFMRMYNQIVKNASVDDADNLLYTDEEIAFAKQTGDMTRKMQLLKMQQEINTMLQPPVTATTPTTTQPAAPAQSLAPAPQIDPAIAEDRALGKQQLIERGLSEQEAEAAMQKLDQESMAATA